MFDVGFAELSLLAVIGLLVLGPEKLPRVARTIGGYLRKGRQAWNSVRMEIQSELDAKDLKDELQKPIDELDELRRSTKRAAQEVTSDLDEQGRKIEDALQEVEKNDPPVENSQS